MLLILTAPQDEHAAHVQDVLRERGYPVAVFDPADFPGKSSIEIELSSQKLKSLTLKQENNSLDLLQVRAIWLRRPGRPKATDELADEVGSFVEQESAAVLNDLWSLIRCKWIPARPHQLRVAGNKTMQLVAAQDLGFTVPATVLTNSPTKVLSFYQQNEGGLISKLASSSLFGLPLGQRLVRFTERVTAADLVHVNDISLCPMIFQSYVDKRIELRITIIGTSVFAAEIHSQATHHTKTDWRRYDMGNTVYEPHALPPHIERQCVALTAFLGLNYSTIDMIVTPNNEYVFLELNPNGQYLWIEYETGMPLTASLCDLLSSESEQTE